MSTSPETGDRLRAILRLFERTTELPEAAREGFLERTADHDPEAVAQVREMLAADAETTSAMDRPVVHPPRSTAGTAVGPYRLVRQIGEGGMGTVYEAVRDDATFRRRVVVKLIRAGMENDELRRRFQIERQILAGLDHPNIARIYDGGKTDDDRPYLVMEHVDGVPIDAHCDGRRLPIAARVGLFLSICEAVQVAHQNLVVHRDLKPSNILVTGDGTVKLLDFGIAKLLNADLLTPEIEATATWQRLLTPHYASPEHLQGRAITTASDVFSLGVLLYRLLSGRLPFRFDGRSPAEIERMLVEDEPPRVSAVAGSAEHRRRLAGDLDAIVSKAMEKHPVARYDTVSALAADLRRWRDGRPVVARQGGWRYRAGKLVRRHRRAVAAIAAVALLFLALTASMAVMLQRLAVERDQTARERDQAAAERDRATRERRDKERFLDLVLGLFEKGDPYVSREAHAAITVREALDQSLLQLERAGDDHPDQRAEMLIAIGVIYRNLGLYEQAEAQLRRALDLRHALHGEEHVDVARTENALATVLQQQEADDLEQAERLAARAVATLAAGAGTDDPAYLDALNTHVSVLCYRSDYQAAEPLAERAVALSRTLAVDDVKLAAALNNLATAKVALGDYARAAELYNQSVALRRSVYGAGSPWLIRPLINLGVARRRLEQLDGAADAYAEATRIQTAVLGAEHPSLFATLFNLGRLEQARGRPEEALRIFRRAAAIQGRASGAGHRNLLTVGLRIEEARIDLGRSAEAAPRLRALLATWRPRLDPASDPLLAIGEGLLGEALSALGVDLEAEALLVASYERLLQIGKHRHQIEALERLAAHLRARGRDDELAAWQARMTPTA